MRSYANAGREFIRMKYEHIAWENEMKISLTLVVSLWKEISRLDTRMFFADFK